MFTSHLATLTVGLGSLLSNVKGFEVPELTWISEDSSLPKVVIYNARGTILSASNWTRLDNINYGSGPPVTVDHMVGNVSEVLKVAQLAVVNFPVSGGSAGLNSSLFLNITQHANRHLCDPESDIAGGIMFHGTNTLEETAFGVDLTLNCSKPFVATGAMRPDTYISPDGRSNFFQAVATAASPAARDRGGLIAFNDRITSIYYSTKSNANTPDTFKALEQGNVGSFLGGQPYFYFGPSYPTGRPWFDVKNTTELPAVVIVYGHQGFDASLMTAAVANGAKGIVHMGSGAASLSPSARVVTEELRKAGIPVVTVTRSVAGTGMPTPAEGAVIYASYLGGPQARIMLQLAINAGLTIQEIQDLFEAPLRDAIYAPAPNKECEAAPVPEPTTSEAPKPTTSVAPEPTTSEVTAVTSAPAAQHSAVSAEVAQQIEESQHIDQEEPFHIDQHNGETNS
ncbi:putative L-asparaginase [Podospora fimiseda]|uniref:asparaginase n=1 Tax=Podospora fimiseda TaxID=252190 RepID=A0AAN7BII5_9PEZI|nr:putative L-asparaginase [Podospora fimiseda]